MAGRDQLVYGTCVALGPAGVLLRGRSGAGKSDLALRFLAAYGAEGARLVADDRVCLAAEQGRLTAAAPAAIAGRMEVRGLGIVPVPHVAHAELRLVVDLVARAAVPRLPPEPPATVSLLGHAVPALELWGFEPSAPTKLKLALSGRL